MLARIDASRLSSVDVPTVLAFDSGCAVRPSVLVTDSRKTMATKSGVRLGQAHLHFLCETGGANATYRCDLSDRAHPELVARHPTARSLGWPYAVQCSDSLALCRKSSCLHAHGDFTPGTASCWSLGSTCSTGNTQPRICRLATIFVHYLLAIRHDDDRSPSSRG